MFTMKDKMKKKKLPSSLFLCLNLIHSKKKKTLKICLSSKECVGLSRNFLSTKVSITELQKFLFFFMLLIPLRNEDT